MLYWCNMPLVGIDNLSDMIKLTLQTAFIEPYKPNSLLLIARPETAKTSVINVSRKGSFVFFTNEITAKMMVDIILPLSERKEVRMVAIPDILNCLEKQKSTRQQFLNAIKSYIEEGISSIQTYHKRFVAKTPVRGGLITAITMVDFRKVRKYIENIGLLSRLIPFSYDYPISKVRSILDAIESETISSEDIDLKIVEKDQRIKGNSELFKRLEIVTTKLGEQCKGFGFRAQERMQALCKANAMLSGRSEVKKEDIEKIMKLSDWINFDFNPI